MKVLKRIIYGVIIIGIILSGGYIITSKLTNNFKPSTVSAEILKAARGIKVYQLESNRGVSFPLLTQCENIRIATNAEFSDAIDLKNSSIKEPYIVEVQAFDINGKLIETRTINYFTKTQFYFEEEWGMYLSSFYIDSTAIPSETRVSTINFRDTNKVAEIKLRRIDNNTNLSTVYARVYQPTGIHQSQLDFYWFNIMPKDKERLASANLYPVSMIKEEERQNLIKNLWTLVGPAGIPGDDYFEKKLYSISNPKGIPYDINLLHSGNYVDDNHQLVVPIEEDGSEYKLEVITADIIYPKYMKIWLGEPDTNVGNILKQMRNQTASTSGEVSTDSSNSKQIQFVKGQQIEIAWRGRGINRTVSNKENMDRHFVRNYKFDSGLVTISSNAPAYINVLKKSNGVEESILMQPASVNLIRLDPADGIEFDINHSDDETIPLRVDFRKISDKIFDQKMKENVIYELVDAQGKIIKRDTIILSPLITKLDFVVRKGNLYISDKERYFFNLSKNVAKIRLTGSKDVFISVYNRLESFVRHYVIPEDYKTAESKVESLRRTWFYKIPNNYFDLRMNQRTILIKTQPRSLPENELVKASLYDWQEVLPYGNNWSGVEIIEKKEAQMAARPEAEAVEFSLVPINKETLVNITGFLGEKFVMPTMILSGDHGAQATIYLDQKEFFKATLQGKSDELQLPNIEVGSHSLMIKTDNPLVAFINYNKNNDLNYIKHNIIKLNSKNQQYIFEKTNDEDKVLTLKVYSPNKTLREISISIEGSNSLPVDSPLASYTIKNRDYQISFTKSPENQIIINDRTIPLYAAEPIFIKIGVDLPKGSYKINLMTETPQEFYVALSSLVPGLVDKRSISTEVQDEDQ